MRHIETFTKESKTPPQHNLCLFPLNNDNYKKPPFRRGHIFGRGAAGLSTKEDCVMTAPATSEIQILHIESNTKQPSKINTSTKRVQILCFGRALKFKSNLTISHPLSIPA